MKDLVIRPATEADFNAMWSMFRSHVDAGETCAFGPDTCREDCHDYWFAPESAAFVALQPPRPEYERRHERLLGMYKLQPTQVGRGAHVASAAYMVNPYSQGVGVGRLLGEHSIGEARRLGYLAMQFNYVVSTNGAAIHLWKRLGFSIVGTLPKAYRHRRLGYVDAYIMYRLLEDPVRWPQPEVDAKADEDADSEADLEQEED